MNKANTETLPGHVAKFIKAHCSAIYSRKPLVPGRGGQPTDEEVTYIQSHLQRDTRLAYK